MKDIDAVGRYLVNRAANQRFLCLKPDARMT